MARNYCRQDGHTTELPCVILTTVEGVAEVVVRVRKAGKLYQPTLLLL